MTIGGTHTLGVFFKLWREDFNASDSSVIWVQSAAYATIRVASPLVLILYKVRELRVGVAGIPSLVLILYKVREVCVGVAGIPSPYKACYIPQNVRS